MRQQDSIPSKIADLASGADADSDIDDQFSNVDTLVRKMQYIAEDDERVTDLLGALERSIDEAKEAVKARKSEDESGDSFFNNVPSATLAKEATSRSLFSGVDD